MFILLNVAQNRDAARDYFLKHFHEDYVALEVDTYTDLATRAYLTLVKDFTGVNYFLLQALFFFAGLLCVVLAVVAQLFSRDMVQEVEKKSPYECGFFPFDSATRLPFDVHFYVVGIMFLVFDVELIILTTIIILAASLPWSALASVAGFVIVLSVGFVYEWNSGALRWEAKIPEPLLVPANNSISPLSLLLPVLFDPFITFEFPALSGTISDFVVLGLVPFFFVKGLPFFTRRAAFTKVTHMTGRTDSTSNDDGVIPSWRPRLWVYRVPFRYKKRWSRKWTYIPINILCTNRGSSGLRKVPGLGRHIRAFLLTQVIPSVHYNCARIHRWPVIVVLSCFVVPAIAVPWPWFMSDYREVWHDLCRLIDSVEQWVHGHITVTYFFPRWVRILMSIPLLYPAAMLNLLFNYHWPFMLLVGLALARCLYIYADGSLIFDYWSWSYRWARNNRCRRYLRNKRYDVYDDYFEENRSTAHPDRQYTDDESRGSLLAILVLLLLSANNLSPELFDRYLPEDWAEPVYESADWTYRMIGAIPDDIRKMLRSFNKKSVLFSLLIIVCGIMHGFTGIVVPLALHLMYPRSTRPWIPAWNLCVLVVSLYMLVQCLELNNTIHKVGSWIWRSVYSITHKPSILLSIGVAIGYTMYLGGSLVAILIVRPIWRAYMRHWTGRYWAFTKLRRHSNALSNNEFNHQAFSYIFDPAIEQAKFVAAKRAENAAKRSPKTQLTSLPLFLICTSAQEFPALSSLSFTMYILPILLSCFPITYNLNLTNLYSIICDKSPVWMKYIYSSSESPNSAHISNLPYTGTLHEYVPTPGFYWTTFVQFLPEVVLAIAITFLLLIASVEVSRGQDRKFLAIASWRFMCKTLTLVGALYAFQLVFVNIPSLPALDGYMFTASGLTFSKLFVLVTSLLVLHSSEKYIREHTRPLLEYPIIISIGVLLLLILVAANNLMTVFLSLAGFSLSLYILILCDVTDRPSREAAMKYFYLSTMSAGLLLMGTFIIYYHVGSVNYFMIDTFFFEPASRGSAARTTCCSAIIFILFGFFFKLSAFPGHLWASEVYEGSPAPVLAFFILPVKVAIFLTFVRVLNSAFNEVSQFWMPYVAFAAVGSLAWGAVAAINSRKISRFLAYASINQMGFLLLGASLDTFEALRATYIYLLLYALMTGGFMLVFLHTRRADGRPLVFLSDFCGLARVEDSACWSLAVYLFSMAGIPPLAGFFSKYYIMAAALAKGTLLLVVVALAVSLISAYYYLRIIKAFWFEEPAAEKQLTVALTSLQRVVMVSIEATLWIFSVAALPLFPAVDSIIWPLIICG